MRPCLPTIVSAAVITVLPASAENSVIAAAASQAAPSPFALPDTE
ncbi:MAG TPA: hypothetical protein VN678_07670 [Acidobacteriaceae bacterium]|nr:hypothetical protein [Acidobacteriaceae bacterium]